MLCSKCLEAINASSQRVDQPDRSYFRHHSSIPALRAAAEDGCPLCVMLLYQIPEHPHKASVGDAPVSRASIKLQELQFQDSSVTYTLDDGRQHQGIYILDVCVEVDNEKVLPRIYFVRIDNAQITETLPEIVSQELMPCRTMDNGILESSLPLVRAWIDGCLTTHRQCRGRDSEKAFKFSRILDIGTQDERAILRLISREKVPEGSEYMTLSHRWGELEITTLQLSNIEKFHNVIEYEELPQTFRDAILTTRLLGVHYLWIDSLCIVQNSEDDWADQAAQMGEIYRHSWCNLAATAAVDGRNGLFRFLDRHPASLESLIVDVPGIGQPTFDEVRDRDPANLSLDDWTSLPHPREGTVWRGMAPGSYECVDRDLWFRNVSDSPLGRRAWVVQERLLAPRVLHFGRWQLFWECNSLKACELYPQGLPDKADLLSTAELKSEDITSGHAHQKRPTAADDWNDIGPCSRILQSWDDVVKIYSRAELTFEKDKLAALAGLAQLYAKRVSAQYLGGIWALQLPRHLMWAVRWPKEPPGRCMAPSWSWASANGELRNIVDIDDTIERSLASVLDVKCTGDFLECSGTLSVKGRLIPCNLSCDHSARYDKQCNPYVRGLERAAFVRPDTQEFLQLDLKSRCFFCVPWVIFYDATEPTTPEVGGLVIEATDQKGKFRRFGAFRTDNAMDRDGDRHPDWIENDQVQPRKHTRYGRVFLMDVENELAEVDERFYLSYAKNPAKREFASFTFTLV